MLFFFFKQKTAYEMRISDWSSDVLLFRSQAFAAMPPGQRTTLPIHLLSRRRQTPVDKNGRTQRANLAPVTRDDTLQKGHIGGQIMASGGKLANAVRG